MARADMSQKPAACSPLAAEQAHPIGRLTAWSTVHGLATILIDGAAIWTVALVAPDGIEPLIERVVHTLLVGVQARANAR